MVTKLMRRGGVLLLPVALLLGVTGCVDDDAGRQFANDPKSTSELPTSEPTWPVPTPRVATPQASPLSAEQLLQTRGAAGRFYFESNGELWTMAPREDHAEPVFSPAMGTTIRALASSPSGDRVAAILVQPEGDGEVADLVVLSMDGAEVYRHDNLNTLVPDEAAEVVSLNWSPQGEKLLVALSPGGLVSVPLSGDGEPMLIVAGGVAAQPAQAAWSPTGEEVGFLARTDDDRSSLFVSGVAATPVAPRALLPEEVGQHTIFDWSWLPDGRSLIFSEERELTSTADLWRIKSDGSDRELVASAGSVAPVARIVGAKPSRDGRSVAYQVIVPGDDGVDIFDSLWVRDLASNRGFRIDVPAGLSVTNTWWTDAGLMFRAVPGDEFHADYSGGPYALFRVTDGSTATMVFEFGSSPDGTPVASPVPSEPEQITPPAT
jgi:hypothetical protein